MKASIRSRTCRGEVKLTPAKALLARIENQTSTWLSQEAWVGRRMSTARCYLDPVRKRRNLHIETEALTEGLVLGGKRCTGVRYSVAGDVREARAAREVVVSAGTINSPQLLELSGIGQPERLRNLGIEVRPRTARRRRKPPRPLRAAHPLADRQKGHHLQRSWARPPSGA
jgi:choline dehydrogenase-like flavoprotein